VFKIDVYLNVPELKNPGDSGETAASRKQINDGCRELPSPESSHGQVWWWVVTDDRQERLRSWAAFRHEVQPPDRCRRDCQFAGLV
jgi:hypothetical protein